MPFFGSAGHISTSTTSITSSHVNNSMISQGQTRDKDFTHTDYQIPKDISGTSLVSNQRASEIAAEIYAEAQSSMMKSNNKLPSFSDVSNVGSDKRQQGYDPFDFSSNESKPVNSRPENTYC